MNCLLIAEFESLDVTAARLLAAALAADPLYVRDARGHKANATTISALPYLG